MEKGAGSSEHDPPPAPPTPGVYPGGVHVRSAAPVPVNGARSRGSTPRNPKILIRKKVVPSESRAVMVCASPPAISRKESMATLLVAPRSPT